MRRTPTSRAAQWVHGLGYAAWACAATGAASTFVLPGGNDGRTIRIALLVTTTVFFALQLGRLLVVAGTHPGRRLGLLLLAAGVTLWAAGSATVSASQASQVVTFPAPGEALYLLSYLGIVCWLLLDVPRRQLPTAAVWLEGAVVCGAAACLAAFAVLSPVQSFGPKADGLTLLLAVLYPLIDVALGTMVLAQMLLRQRDRSRRTLLLAAGFLGLAVADSSFLPTLSQDSYTSSIALDVLWGASWAVLITAACSEPGPTLVLPKPQSAQTLVAAASVALVVLVLHPGSAIGVVVTIPAIITLVCAGARMVLALHEARGAAEAMRLSLTDELTGLPNRRAVLAAADAAMRFNAPLAFMLLDLDGFKDINDSLGHGTGDDVLSTVAHRMRAALPADLMVARLGGDEFALLAPYDDELTLLETAHRVREVLLEPVHIAALDLTIGSSIGITVRAPDDSCATDLLRRADIAMYEAKEAKAGALLYDTSQDGFSAQRLQRAESLRHGIDGDELVLWYQPQVDAATRRITAMEALVRWDHPREGMLTPAAFLVDARRAGLMPALSDVVMRQVVRDARRFADAGLHFRVAMNCAPPELLGGQLLPRLFDALSAAGLSGDAVLVEVTEDSFLSDPERARAALSDLQAHGVQASIDDYGTGFSSLAYLRDLPVQELKMDRSFVATLLTDERTRLIVETTTKMAHAMGLRLVAEGVEDEETACALVEMDVDVLQGYHIAAPMPVEAVGPWVRRWATQPLPELSRLLPVPRGY